MKRGYCAIDPSVTALWVLLLLLPAGHAARVGAEENDLLNLVKQKDLSLRGGAYTVSFSMQKRANLDDPNQGTVFMDCRAAQNERGTLAIKIIYYYEKDPVFVAPGSRGYGSIDYLGGNLIVWRKTEKYVLSSRVRNRAIERRKCYLVDPNNRVLRADENTLVYRWPVGSDDNCPAFRHFRRSVGWGYAQHLARLVSTEPVDGLVRMTAEGSCGTGPEGIWELSVDPNSDYMIRCASFRRKGADKPSMIAKNSGILAKDNVKIAQRGTYEAVGLLRLSVEAGDLAIGPSGAKRFIDEVAAVVDALLPAGASILDLRGPRPVRTTVESPGRW